MNITMDLFHIVQQAQSKLRFQKSLLVPPVPLAALIALACPRRPYVGENPAGGKSPDAGPAACAPGQI